MWSFNLKKISINLLEEKGVNVKDLVMGRWTKSQWEWNLSNTYTLYVYAKEYIGIRADFISQKIGWYWID